MQLCKKPVHSYGRYKQAVQLYMPSSPSGIVEEVVEEVAEEVAETLVDIGSATLDTAIDLYAAAVTTGITYGQSEVRGGTQSSVFRLETPAGTMSRNNPRHDPAVPDSMINHSTTLGFQVGGFGFKFEKRTALPMMPEDAPETDTDDEKKKSTTGD